MMETLEWKDRKARKEHYCDFCSGIIQKGEVYDWSKHVNDGKLYEWKSHKKCSFLCGELWDYADPDEGMDEETFRESMHDFCRAFICPDCTNWDKEYDGCNEDNEFCVDKAYEFLQTHELYRDRRDMFGEIWKCRKMEKGEKNDWIYM